MKIAYIVVIVIIISSLVYSYSGINFSVDADLDEIPNWDDNCPNISNPLQEDYDKDGLGDICDPDDDNDKVVDAIDVFDNDPNEWADFDFDGIGSNQDKDDDNDGILDENDSTPIPISEKLTQQHMAEIENCIFEDEENRFLCFRDFFVSLVEQETDNADPLRLSIALQQIGALDDCHFVAHFIGHESFAETLDLNFEDFEVYGLLCRGGYVHGIMGSFFHNLQDNNEPLPDDYRIICNELSGTTGYSECVHGLGHGLMKYYPNDLESAVDHCSQMSYWQEFSCINGVMMQYTDDRLTKFGITKENISNMCSELELNEYQWYTCNSNIGISLAFHYNHNADLFLKYCLLLDDNTARYFCDQSAKNEIIKYRSFLQKQVIEKEDIKLKSIWIKQEDKNWIVDFLSAAIISDFDYIEETKEIQFSFDAPKEIQIFVWKELLPEIFVVAVNGMYEENVKVRYTPFQPFVEITISPTKSGTVLISSDVTGAGWNSNPSN